MCDVRARRPFAAERDSRREHQRNGASQRSKVACISAEETPRLQVGGRLDLGRVGVEGSADGAEAHREDGRGGHVAAGDREPAQPRRYPGGRRVLAPRHGDPGSAAGGRVESRQPGVQGAGSPTGPRVGWFAPKRTSCRMTDAGAETGTRRDTGRRVLFSRVGRRTPGVDPTGTGRG
jgi:hypothetical protein